MKGVNFVTFLYSPITISGINASTLLKSHLNPAQNELAYNFPSKKYNTGNLE